MYTTRRDFGAALASAGVLAILPAALRAQSPLQTLKILVGFPAGGSNDAVARQTADGLRGTYAQNAVVDNRPGAAGRIAMAQLMNSPADGATMLVQPESVVTLAPHTDPKNATIRPDHLAQITSCALVRQAFGVGPMVPPQVKTVKDFLEWARANPGKASYGSPGPYSPQEFLFSALMREQGVAVNHIPYKGSAPGITDLLGGQVAAFFSPVGDWLPHLKDGRLRVLALASARRSTLVPEIPTFAEQGFANMLGDETAGVVMHKSTPMQIQQQAAKAVAAALARPQTVQAFAQLGLEVVSSTPEEYTRHMQDSFLRWGQRVKASGFKPET